MPETLRHKKKKMHMCIRSICFLLTIFSQGGIELCIAVLAETNQMLQLLCTETIANLAKFRKARRLVRRHGGLPRLIDLLDIGDHSRVSIYTENYLYMYI